MDNFQEKANFIWSVADLLRGDYKQSEYGRVVLPLKGGATVKGITDVGTAAGDDPEEALSRIIELVNDKFGTEWTPADQLFLDQIAEENRRDEELMESARVNSEENMMLKFPKIVEGRFIDRLDQNSAMFERIMGDPLLKDAVTRLPLEASLQGGAG